MLNGFLKMSILAVCHIFLKELTRHRIQRNCTVHRMQIFADVTFIHFARPHLFGDVTHSRSRCWDA